eukprot:TRINITY_DN2216_c0_g1_i1.p1 TRINITY_DN2216_c0_g1~~TRINITY_DN2216_c0_g1_i1.p1  ORF type:complete len:326 (+),score=93.46 TRINITY_DN2216_c0_g1_i1:64-1041(+)
MGRRKGGGGGGGGGGGHRDKGRKGRHRQQVSEWDHEADVRKLNQSLAAMSLHVRDVPSDGNCLFSAVSDQLYGDWRRSKELRARCVEELERSRDDYAPFIAYEDGEDWDTYVSDMARDGEWGGQLELNALAAVLKVDVVIHSANVPRRELRVGSDRVIHVSYHLGEHYCSVRYTGSDPEGFRQRWLAPAAAGGQRTAYMPPEALRALVDEVKDSCPWAEDCAIEQYLRENDYDAEAAAAAVLAAEEGSTAVVAEPEPAAAAVEEEPQPKPPKLTKEEKREHKKNRRLDKEIERAARRRQRAAEMAAAANAGSDDNPPPSEIVITM